LDWLYNLPVLGLSLVVFGAVYLATALILLAVIRLAVGERARVFKAMSPGMLPPLGIIFGLLMAFVAAQVWNDLDRANAAVNREASALRAVVLLSGGMPDETEARLQDLVRRHIMEVVQQEWPAMARRQANLTMTSPPLAEALLVTLSVTPRGEGQANAQREILVALENALDARRQRIIVSGATVDWLKWTSLLLMAVCMLVAVAMVHCDNSATAAWAMGLFATGVAVSIVLIAAHNRPFTGDISVGPGLLLQVLPGAAPPPGP
jgi:Protein of unknown function (DUF4239)